MELTYENMLKFVKEYFTAFNKYGQDPETTHRMDAYFAPDLEYIPYVAILKPISGRDKFLSLMSAHPSSTEILTPEDIVIDDRRKAVSVLVKAEVSDAATKKLLVSKKFHVFYQLILDQNQTIKVKTMVFFEQGLPPGSLDLDDVYKRDAGIADLYQDPH